MVKYRGEGTRGTKGMGADKKGKNALIQQHINVCSVALWQTTLIFRKKNKLLQYFIQSI